MIVLSLFDGISAAQQAFKNLGIEFDGINNIYYSSEIDKYAIKVTQTNFPNTIQLGDVNNIDFNDYYSKIDLVVGGFPCQNFSCAGNGTGLNGETGKLFFKCVEAIEKIKPKYFLFENVASMKKETKYQISKYLGVDFVTINSALLTAQQRKRIYYCGILQNGGTYKTAYIPQPQDKGIVLKDILESGLQYQEKSHALTATYDKAVFWNSIKKNQRTMIAEPICVASRGRYDKNGNLQQQLEPNLNYKTNTLTSVSKDNLILSPLKLGYLNSNSQGNRIYSVKGKSVALSSSSGGLGSNTSLYKIDLPDGDYITRKLTINECCKLQGFPDNFCNIVSKSQGYKALGNSFTVPVIEHLLKSML